MEPPFGPVGATITIKGNGFRNPGMSTKLTIGETTLTEAELAQITSKEIILSVPETLIRGPKLPVIVSTGGIKTSPAAYYEVKPWIDRVLPLRGITGIPLTIPYEVPSGNDALSVEIGGVTAAAVSIDVDNKQIVALVPATITTNGPKPVVIIQGDNPPQRSNARFYEVIPVIQSVEITSVPPVSTTIKVTGKRLSGKDVYIKYGAVLLIKGVNTESNRYPSQCSVLCL
ncbi:MAG TPA: IPT/TIG domain-containing protein [Thermodesulfovibrionia bacterium]|nr:IPT/TIG domain-containing protein [Thermodesulfovibrionia bacterium]